MMKNGLGPAEIIETLLGKDEVEILETTPISYKCYCSRERVSRAIISMGKEEMQSLIEEQGGAELTCQFCDKVYRFTKEDLQELLEEATR